MRLVAFDYFRGIAILFIVARHCYGTWAINSFGEKLLVALISEGTVLFVFISGFLFHHVFYKKFYYKDFLKKKAKNVLLPYLFLSALGLIYYAYSPDSLPFSKHLGIDEPESWMQYFEIAAIYLWTGRTAIAYWFIPVILIIFTMSPFFIRYIKLSTKKRIYLILILLVISVYIGRPDKNLSPFHSFLYYIPVYMLGITCSINREAVMDFIKDKSMILGLIVLLLSIIQVIFFGILSIPAEIEIGVDELKIDLVQKIIMCFFLLSILQKYEHSNLPGLKFLASTSFAIYFIHPWVLLVFVNSGMREYLDFLPGMVVFLITIPLVIISCLLIAYVFKRVLKENSRHFIGW